MSFLETGRLKVLLAALLGTVLLLLIAFLPTRLLAQRPDDQTVNLDIILLIDNSWSMSNEDPVTEDPPSDPEGLRIRAAKFLVDYLRANADTLDANFRVGVVSFGGVVSDTMPLRLLQDETVREGIGAEEILFTDFRGPLRFAHREFRASSFGSSNKKAVILFTDGRPQLTDNPMSEQELEAHFDDLAPLVGDLQGGGASLFVLGIGDARKDRDNWTELIPNDHYIPITSATELADVYLSIVAELLGRASSAPQTLPAGGSASIQVPPYLDQLTLSFMRKDPGSRITVTSPSGAVLTPTVGGAEDVHHAIYGIRNPSPGEWTVSGEEEARYWVEERPPFVRIEPARTTFLVGQPVTVTASLVRAGETVVDPALRLELVIAQPGGGDVAVPLPRRDGGRYVGSYEEVEAAGTYTMTGRAFLGGEPLDVRSESAVVTVFPLSAVAPSDPAFGAAQAQVENPTPTPAPVEQGTGRLSPPWFWLVLGPLAAAALAFLVWMGWRRLPGRAEREDVGRREDGLEWFMDAVRSRDYADARAAFDRQDEATQARWLYRAEEYICTEELGVAGAEGQPLDEGSRGLRDLLSQYLGGATASYAAGDVDGLREQCGNLLRWIRHNRSASQLRDQVQQPFVRWFGDAVDTGAGESVKAGERHPHIARLDDLRRLLRAVNLQALRGDGRGGEQDWPGYREATEDALAEKGWEGVVVLWGVGEHHLANPTLRLIARLLLDAYQDDILEGILLLLNARTFANSQRQADFYEAICDVLRIASEMARREDRDLAYRLCDGFGRLAWKVANRNAGGASLALTEILDALDAHQQGRGLRHGEDVFGLCYLLMSLDAGRALSGDGSLHFFQEAKDTLARGPRYVSLLNAEGPLALQGLPLVEPTGRAEEVVRTLERVRGQIAGDPSLPGFERTTVVLLLHGLIGAVETRAEADAEEVGRAAGDT